MNDSFYMQIALLYASQSKAIRKKVGAVLVTSHGVLIPGYNGTVSGSDNRCEHSAPDGSLVTKPGVLHAELNCILKCSKEGISTLGSTLYCTLSPCEECAAMIAAAGIQRVVFLEAYRNTAGIKALERYNVDVESIK